MFGLSLVATRTIRDLEAKAVRENAAAHIAHAEAVVTRELAVAERELRQSTDALLRIALRLDPLSPATRERVEQFKAHYRASVAQAEPADDGDAAPEGLASVAPHVNA